MEERLLVALIKGVLMYGVILVRQRDIYEISSSPTCPSASPAVTSHNTFVCSDCFVLLPLSLSSPQLDWK